MSDNDMDYDDIVRKMRNSSYVMQMPGIAADGADAIDQLRARVAELEQRRVYWTCTVGGETFTTQDHEVCDSWDADGYPVRVCVADDPRVAELEAERADIRAARDAAWDQVETLYDDNKRLRTVCANMAESADYMLTHATVLAGWKYYLEGLRDKLRESANEPAQERVEIEGE